MLTADALYDDEPVAGLSDAFLIGDSELHVYHTMNVQNPDIMSKTVVRFRAKPTCVQQESCAACASLRESSEFECAWCEKVRRQLASVPVPVQRYATAIILGTKML